MYPANQQYSNYGGIALISHDSKLMRKILQASLQQCVNQEIPNVQAGFRKSRGTRDQIIKIHCIIYKAREFQNKQTNKQQKKAREFQKNIYFCFIDYTEAFDYVDHNCR